MRWLVWPCHDLRYEPWPLLPRGALRARGGRELGARDALLSHAFRLRGVSRLPYDVAPRVRGALLPCDDALLPSLTSVLLSIDCCESNRVNIRVNVSRKFDKSGLAIT